MVGRRLLGAHVAQRAQQVAGRRQARIALEAGQAEVGDPQVPQGVDHQVRRLDVAVQHPLLMGVLQRLGGLAPSRAASRKNDRPTIEGEPNDQFEAIAG